MSRSSFAFDICCGVAELRRGGVVVWGSYHVGESRCRGVGVWGTTRTSMLLLAREDPRRNISRSTKEVSRPTTSTNERPCFHLVI